MRIRQRLRWALRRGIAAIPVLLLVATATFFIVDVLPGNAAEQLLGPNASREQVEALAVDLGLDRPRLIRYGEWLLAAVKGDLGHSMSARQPVVGLIGERFHITIELVSLSVIIALGIAIPCAVVAAYRPSSMMDRLLLAISMASISIPSYVLSLVLVLVFAVTLRVLPSMGYVAFTVDPWRHFEGLVLPAAALAIPLCGLYLRFLRAEILERLARSAYVLTAVAKGLSPLRIITRHCLRPALPGLITIVSLNFAVLVSSTVVIEQLFAIPGLGSLLLQAVSLRDYPVVQGLVLALTFLAVTGMFLGELLVAWLDPRSASNT